MSLTILHIIPADEKYLPNISQAEMILNFIERSNRLNLKVEYEDNGIIRFYDCGENFEKVTCPCCGKNLDIEWWQDEMDRTAESEFSDLRIITPCCSVISSLNELNYCFPQGFARFAININDYENDKFIIDKSFLSQLELYSGVSWKVIISRY